MNRLYRSIGICCTIPAALHYHKRRSFGLLAKTEQKTDIRPYIEWRKESQKLIKIKKLSFWTKVNLN